MKRGCAGAEAFVYNGEASFCQMKSLGGSLRDRQKKLLELLEKSGASLYAFLTQLTLREEIAEELMQELFMKLSDYKGLDKVVNWGAYARRVAINLAFDWRRKQKQTALRLSEVREPASNCNSPLAKLVQTEELQEVLDAVCQLRGASREAFVMRYVGQSSYGDIAEQMGKTPHQVRALCFKALSHIRYLLSDSELRTSGKERYDAKN